MFLATCSTSTGVLATTDELRTAKGTTSTANDDAEQAALDAAIEWAEDVLGYPLSVNVYQELVPAFGTQELLLSRAPVRHVFSVFDASDSGTAAELLSSEYRLQPEPGILQRDEGYIWTAALDWNITSNPAYRSETPEWRVDYSAGYIGSEGQESTADGTTSTGTTLPRTIHRAIMMKALELLNPMVGGIVEEAVGDLRVRRHEPRFRDQPRLDVAQEMLRPYIRIRVG
jgi:hypothetical protein